ncbi:19068_t:CDS:2 [Funneliformis geosporum]|uniref:19068_t:CDS:1 n=1 Tax=Funneliformis geosporum TaxID=1117311 RepID=A0A9W4SHK6_9GLOM|nr:19068_t:CDS:2 [Funneliformis geosporum]
MFGSKSLTYNGRPQRFHMQKLKLRNVHILQINSTQRISSSSYVVSGYEWPANTIIVATKYFTIPGPISLPCLKVVLQANGDEAELYALNLKSGDAN